MARVELHNATELSDGPLCFLCEEALAGWAIGRLTVRVRYSRGADFSGRCFYAERRIHVNLGRHLVYPYRMQTYLARAKVVGRHWYKPLYTIELVSGYDVVRFVFMHELYHLLVRRARRNTHQKESMCDRFAARSLADCCGAIIRDHKGHPASREEWDFQDLERFVAAARDRRALRCAAKRPIPTLEPTSARSRATTNRGPASP